jgi:hypothetical protein
MIIIRRIVKYKYIEATGVYIPILNTTIEVDYHLDIILIVRYFYLFIYLYLYMVWFFQLVLFFVILVFFLSTLYLLQLSNYFLEKWELFNWELDLNYITKFEIHLLFHILVWFDLS